MAGTVHRPKCKCEDKKKCKCGAAWAFIVNVGRDPRTGKYRQKTKGGFKTKGEAEKALTEYLSAYHKGMSLNEENITFEDFTEHWLKMYSATGKYKPSTIRIREHEINRLMPFFAKLKMKEITRMQLENCFQSLLQELSNNTVEGIHGTARMIFKKAVELEVIRKDPSEYVRAPRKAVHEDEDELVKYMEKEELSRFLEAARTQGEDKDYMIFLTLAYTGLRIGELIALRWKDLDLHDATLTVNRTYYNPTNNVLNFTLLSPKTKSSKRTIDLAPILVREFEKYKLEQKKFIKWTSANYDDQDFVFAQTRKHQGYPELPKTIQRKMKRLLKLSGVNESLNPHSLRHTHTSLLAEAGVDLQAIMERLGHKDDETTKHVYLHVTKNVKREASHKFAQLMENLSPGNS